MQKETLVSFLIACVIVAGAIWIFGQSIGKNEPPYASQIPSHAPKPSDSTTPPHQREYRADSSSGLVDPSTSSAGAVFKCVVNGKITYSDQACASKSAQQPLTLSDSRGIVSPPKESLEELTAQRRAKEAVYERQVQRQITLSSQSGASECASLEKHIESLDAAARQPQSGQMQDWLRQERKKARDRQFDIHC